MGAAPMTCAATLDSGNRSTSGVRANRPHARRARAAGESPAVRRCRWQRARFVHPPGLPDAARLDLAADAAGPVSTAARSERQGGSGGGDSGLRTPHPWQPGASRRGGTARARPPARVPRARRAPPKRRAPPHRVATELLRGVAVFGKDERGFSHPPQQTQQRADFGLALRRSHGRIDQPMKGALLVALVRQSHPAQLVVWRSILTDSSPSRGSDSWSGTWW